MILTFKVSNGIEQYLPIYATYAEYISLLMNVLQI